MGIPVHDLMHIKDKYKWCLCARALACVSFVCWEHKRLRGRREWCLLTYLCRSIVLKRTFYNSNLLYFNTLCANRGGEGSRAPNNGVVHTTFLRKRKKRKKKIENQKLKSEKEKIFKTKNLKKTKEKKEKEKSFN